MNYELKNQKLKVQFTTSGGSLTSIKDMDGLEYLWQGDAAKFLLPYIVTN